MQKSKQIMCMHKPKNLEVFSFFSMSVNNEKTCLLVVLTVGNENICRCVENLKQAACSNVNKICACLLLNQKYLFHINHQRNINLFNVNKQQKQFFASLPLLTLGHSLITKQKDIISFEQTYLAGSGESWNLHFLLKKSNHQCLM